MIAYYLCCKTCQEVLGEGGGGRQGSRMVAYYTLYFIFFRCNRVPLLWKLYY